MKKHFTVALWLMLCTFTTFSQTVVDIIVNSPDHNTLEAAVIAAELDGTLSGSGPFTVFAPTDAAFAALPDDFGGEDGGGDGSEACCGIALLEHAIPDLMREADGDDEEDEGDGGGDGEADRIGEARSEEGGLRRFSLHG